MAAEVSAKWLVDTLIVWPHYSNASNAACVCDAQVVVCSQSVSLKAGTKLGSTEFLKYDDDVSGLFVSFDIALLLPISLWQIAAKHVSVFLPHVSEKTHTIDAILRLALITYEPSIKLS